MSIYEVLMIVCFGFAWSISIYDSVRTDSTKGENLLSLLMVMLAYVLGTLHKLIYSRDGAVYFYVLNACMVLADVALYVRNRHREIEQRIAVSYGQVMM